MAGGPGGGCDAAGGEIGLRGLELYGRYTVQPGPPGEY